MRHVKHALAGALIGLALCASVTAQTAGRQESPVYHASRPGGGSAVVTPNDSVDLTRLARSLYITTGGTIKCTFLDGSVDTWTVPNNFVMPMEVVRVWADGTTASGIHAIF
jgi:hypothetical protein